jgi:hypothetical protein
LNDDSEYGKEERTNNNKQTATWKSDSSLQQLFHAALEVINLIN